MNIDELTLGQIKQLQATPLGFSSGPWVVGDAYLIRTVTMTLTGRLREIHAHELVLDDAAWIADTGRFATALKNGTLSEVEPFPGAAIVGRGAIVDACKWTHDLPRTQK